MLAVVFAWPGLANTWRFAPGPDATVYLWWTRLGVAEGISRVGARPGVPALIAVIAGTLRSGLIPAVAGLQQALGVSMGLGAVALVHRRTHGHRLGWGLAGLMGGIFAVHLAAGYVSNLVFAVTFLVAAAALARRSRRGVMAAAFLLGGGGLSHPQFFLAGAAILVAAAAVSWMLEPEHGWRSDAGRVLAALGGGGLVVGAGLLSVLAGPASLSVDTSRDSFLRRVGLDDLLVENYQLRFREGLRRFAPWVTLPLAAIGTLQVHSFTRRFLAAWVTFTVIGVPVGFATGWFPPERVLAFGFSLPILAALAITWMWERTHPHHWLSVAVTAALLLLLAVPALNAQRHQTPFISAEDLVAVTLVGRIADTLAPDTPLVFVVDDIDRTATFLATNVGNIARAAVPAERADDVYVFVGTLDDLLAGRPTQRGELEYDALSRITLSDLPEGERAIFVAPEWNKKPSSLADDRLVAWGDAQDPSSETQVFASVPDPRPLPAGDDELRSASPIAIAIAALAVLALLWLTGSGWAWWTFGDRVAAAAAAPAFGVAAITIAGLVVERLGVGLDGWGGPAFASALAIAGGHIVRVMQGKPFDDAAPQVDEAPDHEHQQSGGHDPVPDR
ncbi:MAG: hypothetical protein WEE66_11685 [Actinomycetota bacterium]